jgi:hypothetical protein
MPICITLIKITQMHWIILLFCNTLRLSCNYLILSISFVQYLWTHWLYNIQPNSHMHYLHQNNANALFCCYVNTHAQDNIFHFIWFKNANWIILVLCNTLRLSCNYFISFTSSMQYYMDTTISYLIQFTHALPSLRCCNTLRTKYKYHIQPYSHIHYHHWDNAYPLNHFGVL